METREATQDSSVPPSWDGVGDGDENRMPTESEIIANTVYLDRHPGNAKVWVNKDRFPYVVFVTVKGKKIPYANVFVKDECWRVMSAAAQFQAEKEIEAKKAESKVEYQQWVRIAAGQEWRSKRKPDDHYLVTHVGDGRVGLKWTKGSYETETSEGRFRGSYEFVAQGRSVPDADAVPADVGAGAAAA